MKNLLDLSKAEMTEFFIELGEKRFRADQVFKWIHKYGMDDFANMSDLSKSLRERLQILCEVKAPEIASENLSSDGTIKWLLKLNDGNHIETVFIPESDRGTLCVSSQVGCALDCSFCSTGKQGFSRNLSVSEIIGQVWLAARRLKILNNPAPGDKTITNVVMMGMGEPLLNFDPVVKAMSIMRDDNAYALPRKRVTLSTAGMVPKIDELKEKADVALAISLHAPNDELRNVLVPLNRKYPIRVLIEACKRYADGNRQRRIVIEYIMLKGINDTLFHAKQLVKVLEGLPCKVNLIPFNPHEGTEYVRSASHDIQNFRFALIRAGFITTVRKTRGEDIDAACGQLVGRVIDRTERSRRWRERKLKLRINEQPREEGSWIEKSA